MIQVAAGFRPGPLRDALTAITPVPLAASLLGIGLGLTAAVAGGLALLTGTAWLALLLRPRG